LVWSSICFSDTCVAFTVDTLGLRAMALALAVLLLMIPSSSLVDLLPPLRCRSLLTQWRPFAVGVAYQ
jgi:hypothetical protein